MLTRCKNCIRGKIVPWQNDACAPVPLPSWNRAYGPLPVGTACLWQRAATCNLYDLCRRTCAINTTMTTHCTQPFISAYHNASTGPALSDCYQSPEMGKSHISSQCISMSVIDGHSYRDRHYRIRIPRLHACNA